MCFFGFSNVVLNVVIVIVKSSKGAVYLFAKGKGCCFCELYCATTKEIYVAMLVLSLKCVSYECLL